MMCVIFIYGVFKTANNLAKTDVIIGVIITCLVINLNEKSLDHYCVVFLCLFLCDYFLNCNFFVTYRFSYHKLNKKNQVQHPH